MSDGNMDLERTSSVREGNALEGKNVRDLLETIRKAEKATGIATFVIGECLREIRDAGRKEWQATLGSHVKTMEDVFREIGYSPASGYNYIKIYEVFNQFTKDEPSVMGVPYTRLVHLLPIVHSKDGNQIDREDIKAHLVSARKIGTDKEFREYIADANGIAPGKYCEHTQVEAFYKCKHCRKWVKTNQ